MVFIIWKYQQKDGSPVFPGLSGVHAQLKVIPPVPGTQTDTGLTFTSFQVNSAGKQQPLSENWPILAKQSLEVVWKVKNTGTQMKKGFQLVNTDREICPDVGYLKPSANSLSIPELQPGEEKDLPVILTAPKVAGVIRSTWVVQTPDGLATSVQTYIQLTVGQAWPLRE